MTTAAREFELVLHTSRLAYRGVRRPRGCVDLVVDGEVVASTELAGGELVELDPMTGTTELHPAQTEPVPFGGLAEGVKRVELWLPHNETVELVELRTDEPVQPAEPTGRLWVHHGSSISQGSNAASPSRTWPVIAARRGGVELRNLGFGGSAFVDPFVARVIRDAPADFISVKFGINVVNLDAMRLRTFVPAVHGFLDTIRDGHPDTPLLVVSPICCPIHEDAPGPSLPSFDEHGIRFTAGGDPAEVSAGKLTLSVIRAELARIVEARAKDDQNLFYLDGLDLYGPDDYAETRLPDELHPDAATQQLIGRRFAARAFGAAGPFSIFSP